MVNSADRCRITGDAEVSIPSQRAIQMSPNNVYA